MTKMNNLEELNMRIAALRSQCRGEEQKLQEHWQFIEKNAGRMIIEKVLGVEPEAAQRLGGAARLFHLFTEELLPSFLPEAKWSDQLIRGLRFGAIFISSALALQNFLGRKKNKEEEDQG